MPCDFPVYACLWSDRVTGLCHSLGLLSWPLWGFVESGPCKTTLQVLMCSDWGDLLPKTIHFLPFLQPCCYSGLWAGTAPRPAGIAPGAGGLPAARLNLPSAYFPLNPLIPQSLGFPPVLKLPQSWENHPPTLLGEGDPCVPNAARIAQERSMFCAAAGSFWGCNTKYFKSNHTSRSNLSTQVSGWKPVARV